MAQDIEWSAYTPDYLSRRYDHIAPVYPLFERIFMLPWDIRRKMTAALKLKPGDNVIEIGCGTGKNLQLLSGAVGDAGSVLGIDISKGMLARATEKKVKRKLHNAELLLTDASGYVPGKKINAALFSLSYATMIHRRQVLKKMWDIIEPGGRIVIMDAQYPPGLAGKLMNPLKPFITLFLRASVLGNPHIKITDELSEITGIEPELTEHSMKTYFIAAAEKPFSR